MNRKALNTSLLLTALFFIVYGGTNNLAAHRAHVPSFYFAWEHHIPFIAWTIIPYMSIDLLFAAAPFLCRTDDERKILAQRITAAILLAGLCFLLFPLRFAFNRPPAVGILGFIFDHLRSFDQPFNQFPSLHIALATLLAPIYLRRTRSWLRSLTAIWFMLIVISTLLTFQHHAVDLIGGFALAALCAFLFSDHPRRLPTTSNRRVSLYYLSGAFLFTSLALSFRPFGLLFLWPAFSFAVVAVAYLGHGPGVFQKRNGKLSLAARFVLAPNLLGQYLSWIYYRRRSNAWDELTDNIWIGRRLSKTEAHSLIDAGVTAIIDLTSEFTAPPPFSSLNYLHLPVLDLTAPTAEQLQTAIAFIDQHGGDGIVYIHCKVGYSRTAAIAGAYLLASGQANTAADAISKLRTARPAIIIRPEARDALCQFAMAKHTARLSSAINEPPFSRQNQIEFANG